MNKYFGPAVVWFCLSAITLPIGVCGLLGAAHIDGPEGPPLALSWSIGLTLLGTFLLVLAGSAFIQFRSSRAAAQGGVQMIEWHKVSDIFPPTGKKILTLVQLDGPYIQSDELRPGFAANQDPELYYWQSGQDFDEVTHWAEMPDVPAP